MATQRQSIAVFGGTFDPIHNGHLRSAIELQETFGFDHIRLLPSHRPPLRGQPCASSAQRLAMVRAAVAGEDVFQVDDCELARDQASYTVDTLSELRADLGAAASLTWVMGSDAFNQLHRWKNWQQLFALANVLVLERAEHPLAADPAVAAFADERELAKGALLCARPSGGFLTSRLRQLPISATDIRSRIGAGRSVRYLLPDAVLAFVNEHNLYRE